MALGNYTVPNLVVTINGRQITNWGHSATPFNRTTVCFATLKNGIEVVGVAYRQLTTEPNREIGERSAYDHVVDQVFPMMIAMNAEVK